MDIVKKNLISIICGVVAVIALIAYFVPTNSWIDDLRSEAEKRVAAGKEVEQIEQKKRNLPNLDPTGTTPVALDTFPTKKLVDEGKKATGELKKAADEMLQVAVEMNRQPLLVEGSLPDPSTPMLFQFRDQYNGYVDRVIYKGILKAALPLTEHDIRRELDRLWDRDYKPQIVIKDGKALNEDAKRREFDARTAQYPEELKRQQAATHRLYVSPDTFRPLDRVGGTDVPRVEEIWAAQVLAWSQIDIAKALASANEPYPNVMEAPIKRIHSVTIDPHPLFEAQPGAGPSAAGAPAGIGTSSKKAAVAPVAAPKTGAADFTKSPTGRTSNALYDVVQFRVDMDADFAKMPEVLAAMTRDRFVTVRNVEQIGVVNIKDMRTQGFHYGDKAVARVSLDCETIMIRQWTEPYMPASIKSAMGITPPPAAAATPGAKGKQPAAAGK